METTINWNQLAAQSTVILGAGAIIMKLLWGKITAEINEKITISEAKTKEKIEIRYRRLESKQSEDKKQVFDSVCNLTTKINEMKTDVALQKQTDDRHDREIRQQTDNHKHLDDKFSSIVDKIYNQIQEIRDYVIKTGSKTTN